MYSAGQGKWSNPAVRWWKSLYIGGYCEMCDFSPNMNFVVIMLFLLIAPCTQADTGDVLLESRFQRDSDGWFVTVENGNKKTTLVPSPLQFDRETKKIKSGDQGDLPWYFTAPNKYLGDKSSFYHGGLEFSLVYLTFALPPNRLDIVFCRFTGAFYVRYYGRRSIYSISRYNSRS